MNNIRRKSLTDIKDRIESLKSDLETLLEEENDYLDNIPENMQGGERYEKAENAVSSLENAVSSLEEAMDDIESATE